MASDLVFTEDELSINQALGYPKAYAMLCRDRSLGTFGPPFTFIPFALPQQEVVKAQELEELFPIIDLKAKPTTKSKIFLDSWLTSGNTLPCLHFRFSPKLPYPYIG